ncbi:unnamed protein product [Calypogeia fissa]
MDQSLNFSLSKDKKLNGHNYPFWSYKMEQNYLKEPWYVVRENVSGGAVYPNEPSNPTPPLSHMKSELNGFVIDALPSSWEIFGTMIAGRETTPTFAQLENMIHEEEMCRSSGAFAGEEALFAQSDV